MAVFPQTSPRLTSLENPAAFPENPAVWSAVFAGIVIALMVQTLFNLLGVGLSLYEFNATSQVVAKIGVASIFWLSITSIATMILGGWVAARMSDTNSLLGGALHGILVWSLSTLLTCILAATAAGAIVSGSLNAVGRIVPAAAELGKSVTENVWQNGGEEKIKSFIQKESRQIFAQVKEKSANLQGNSSPEELKPQFNEIVSELVNVLKDENDLSAVRQQLVNFLTQNMHVDQQEAEKTVEDFMQKVESAKQQIAQKKEEYKQKAVDVTERSAHIMGEVSLITFFILLLGAAGSAIGGTIGAVQQKRKFAANTL